MSRLYLDWNATAPLLPEVRDAMIEVMHQAPGNASSIHREGQRARSVMERARRAVARAVDAPPQAVVFTGGATEGNNQVLRTHARYVEGARIACSPVEHPSVLEVVEALGVGGTPVEVLGVDERGRLKRGEVEGALERGATMLSVMWANNEIGNVYPVGELARLAKESGALFHVDGTQALGRIPLSFREVGADYMTLSFHKMGGPKGIGAIVVREGLVLEALLSGGHQERGRRPGTENVVAARGVEVAAKLVSERREGWTEAMEGLRGRALRALEESGVGFELRGDQESRLPNTLNVAFTGVDGEDALLALDLEGVSASSGSACTAGSLEPSHVLLAMGFAPREAKRSVRLSFGPTTGEGEVAEAMERVIGVVRGLQAL